MVMMSKLSIMVFISCCMVFSVTAVEISLSGTIKDGAGAAIAGAVVALVSNASMNDTTNENGEFTLSNGAAISDIGIYAISMQTTNGIGIKGNQLRFSIISPANNGVVSIFSSNGKRDVVIPLGNMEVGVHNQTIPELAPGLYVMHITIDRATTTLKLVNTGSQIFMNDNVSPTTGGPRFFRKATATNVDTLVVKKDGFETLKKAIPSYKQTSIAIVMAVQPVYAYGAAVENTCIDCKVSDLPDASSLSAKNSKLPDPFKKLDGTPITKKSEWRCRRQEILKMAMKYIYGEKPAPPEVVSGTVTDTKITVHVEDKGKKMDFSANIKLPTTGQAPYPAIITMGTGSTTVATKTAGQGVAVINYNYSQVATPGTDGKVDRSKDFKGPFYDMYGTNLAAGNLMAWAWGASRLIDVLQKAGGAIIDYRRLAVTGCSREGKDAFAAGLFDERIALTLPEETSLGGIVTYRIADAKCAEKTQSNFNDQIWLSNNFQKFVNNTSLLPIDAHELVATFAPRGLYGIDNSSSTSMAQQMCPQGGNMSFQGGLEVYKALGCSQNLTYNSTPTNTDHCLYSENYTKSLTENIKKFLFHQPGETGKIEAGTTVPRADWIDWTTPTLENDTKLYVLP
jgi:hypothetical protein